MASDPAAPVPPRDAPLAGTRAQAMQRLQVGMFGLGAMVLLVGLANIIMTNARNHQDATVAQTANTSGGAGQAPASDPLADAGVVPDMPSSPKSTATAPRGPASR
jgi:hypothetical protein